MEFHSIVRFADGNVRLVLIYIVAAYIAGSFRGTVGVEQRVRRRIQAHEFLSTCSQPFQTWNVRIIECDLADYDQLEKDDEVEYDVLYDLAWEGSDQASRNDPDKQKKNVEHISKIIDLAVKFGVKTFIGAGSQAEYGRVSGRISEDCPMMPVSEYGKAKLEVESLSRKLCKDRNIRYVWTRIFSVYGPGMGMDSLITYSISEMLNGRTPKMTKGEQIWDFMFAGDAANALYLLALHGIEGQVYCIAGGEGKSIKEYMTIIQSVANPSVELRFGEIPYQDNQVMELVGDISKLQRDTGFAVSFSFEEGIKKMVEWMTIDNQ